MNGPKGGWTRPLVPTPGYVSTGRDVIITGHVRLREQEHVSWRRYRELSSSGLAPVRHSRTLQSTVSSSIRITPFPARSRSARKRQILRSKVFALMNHAAAENHTPRSTSSSSCNAAILISSTEVESNIHFKSGSLQLPAFPKTYRVASGLFSEPSKATRTALPHGKAAPENSPRWRASRAVPAPRCRSARNSLASLSCVSLRVFSSWLSSRARAAPGSGKDWIGREQGSSTSSESAAPPCRSIPCRD